MERRSVLTVAAAVFLVSLSLILFELLLTRLFAVVLFAQFAHLALALALLGIGVGAIAQHMRPTLMPIIGLERRIGWLGLLLAVVVVAAVLATIHFPVLDLNSVNPEDYQERSGNKDLLLNTGWFVALLPMLAAPFGVGGLVFAGAFQRLRAHISAIYAADLVGGAIGAVIFLPLLGNLAGPDTVFVITLAAGGAALVSFKTAGHRVGLLASGALVVASLALAITSPLVGGIVKIREAAGYSEHDVTFTQWTPLTRLSVWEQGDDVKILLDNTSASEVIRTEAQRARMFSEASRSLVYRLHPTDSRVAILAASAGPEVAAAQGLGFSRIDAIDIASEIFQIVAKRFPDAPANPFLQPGVRHVHADGRAAILRSTEPYDIIQLVHPNLWSAAGILANAWSPSLLETREAFGTYLDHLSPDGTIAFGKGGVTGPLVPAAIAALRQRGASEPWRNIAFVKGASTVLLIKARPWSEAEVATLKTSLETYCPSSRLFLDPLAGKAASDARKELLLFPVMTDDRPYMDTPDLVPKAFADLFKQVSGDASEPLPALYRSVVIQVLFVLSAGILFVLVPLLWRGRSEMAGIRGAWGVLMYVAGLGYGYLAIETVLVHQLVLFVGHPTYAITVVVLAMLLSSGFGSLLTSRFLAAHFVRNLRIVLVGVLILGVVQTWLLPPLLHAAALGLPLGVRLGLTFVGLLPLGFLMGMPFPLAMRILPEPAGGLVPWAWAINGWMSVAASMVTVLVSRLYGYSVAFELGLCFYALALLTTGLLRRPRLVS